MCNAEITKGETIHILDSFDLQILRCHIAVGERGMFSFYLPIADDYAVKWFDVVSPSEMAKTA